MIHKEKGCARIEKIQVIHLLKATVNMALQILFWWHFMYRTEDQATILFSQLGSQSNHSSTNTISRHNQLMITFLYFVAVLLSSSSMIVWLIDCMISPGCDIVIWHLGGSKKVVSKVQLTSRCSTLWCPAMKYTLRFCCLLDTSTRQWSLQEMD